MATLEETLKSYGDKAPLVVENPGVSAWDPSIGNAELAKRAAEQKTNKGSSKKARPKK